MDPASSILFYNPSHQEWLSTTPIQHQSRRHTRSSTKRLYTRSSLTLSPHPDTTSLVPATVIEAVTQEVISPVAGLTPLVAPPLQTVIPRPPLIDLLWSHQFYKRLIGPMESSVSKVGPYVAQALLEGKLMACCDGSYSPHSKLGSHGWVLATETSNLWKGAGPVDAHPTLSSPYRSELGGFVAILHVLNSVASH
jgi:hypothetical protein